MASNGPMLTEASPMPSMVAEGGDDQGNGQANVLLPLRRRAKLGHQRTAMGEFIVPPGGKPLTSLGDCIPSPSDYSPKVDLTTPVAPQYSIAGPYKQPKPDYNASPADNDTQKNMIFQDRNVTLKGKGRMRPYDVRDGAQLNDSVGPVKYKVEHLKTGEGGPKWSCSSRPLVVNGPPNALVHPVDTAGVDNPAPTYRPSSAFWGNGPTKSIGLVHREKERDSPGPAEYTVKMRDRRMSGNGPAYTLAKRLPPPITLQQATHTDSPGPGAYNLATYVGKAVAKSLSDRRSLQTGDFAPAPNMYTLPDEIVNAPAATMAYKRFEEEAKPHPSPTTYSITKLDLPRAPNFTMRRSVKPCYPDILNYPLNSQRPGPGSYEENRNLTSNDNPKFSMGKTARPLKNEVPGPNHYKIVLETKPDAQRAPAFSMGKRVDPPRAKPNPGPAAYYVKPSGPCVGHSMTSRPAPRKQFVTPAPNAYTLQKGQTIRGRHQGAAITLKARASPYVYSGLQTNKVLS